MPAPVPSNGSKSGEAEKIRIEAEVHRLVTARDKKYTNFIEYNNYKLIYRRYAGLFFTIAVDLSDNELSYLETIHLFVELLDSYFSNVCELDIVFNFNKVYSILDEYMLAGEIEETSKREILDRVRLLEKVEWSVGGEYLWGSIFIAPLYHWIAFAKVCLLCIKLKRIELLSLFLVVRELLFFLGSTVLFHSFQWKILS